MATADVAGTIRARALARRRIGPARAHRLAGHRSLAVAVEELAGTPYGRYVRSGSNLAEAEHGIARTCLWHLRVLAGWQSREATEALRVLAGGFVLANLDEQVNRLAGGRPGALFEPGALAPASLRFTTETTRPALRATLTGSAWGDPGAETGRALTLVPRLAWLHRITIRVPAAAGWASSAALLMLAHDVVDGRPTEPAAVRHLRAMVGDCLSATTPDALWTTADRRIRWALEGVHDADDLWRAEVRWWRRLDREALVLLHGGRFTAQAAVGCAAVLAVDAWRTRAALESAALGGARTEVFDASP
jgi:hypothetical protein